MRDRFEDGTILKFELVPKCLEPFPIGEDFDMFADCSNNIDLFDRFEKAVSFKTFATYCASSLAIVMWSAFVVFMCSRSLIRGGLGRGRGAGSKRL
jgi:hypothetical protein